MSKIPDDVRRFILMSIPSVPLLEALLLLRAESSRSWDSHRVASRLYIGEGQASDLLKDLHAAGIASRVADGGFTYAPGQELRQLVDALAVTYAQDLVGVTDLIHSRIDKRAQQFADAFRWKKEGS